VETLEDRAWCETCGVRATGHGRRRVVVRDLPLADRPVVLVWPSACGAAPRWRARPALGQKSPMRSLPGPCSRNGLGRRSAGGSGPPSTRLLRWRRTSGVVARGDGRGAGSRVPSCRSPRAPGGSRRGRA
jgi:hypothetical protein